MLLAHLAATRTSQALGCLNMLSKGVGVIVQRDGMLRYELVAHSRWLSAMDIHPSKDNVVTAAEDCSMSVWQLPVAGAKVSNSDLCSSVRASPAAAPLLLTQPSFARHAQ